MADVESHKGAALASRLAIRFLVVTEERAKRICQQPGLSQLFEVRAGIDTGDSLLALSFMIKHFALAAAKANSANRPELLKTVSWYEVAGIWAPDAIPSLTNSDPSSWI